MRIKYRSIVSIVVLLILQGCSFLVDLALFNNSDESIVICNLNLKEPSCLTMGAKTLKKVLLVADQSASSWRFSITREGKKGIYEFEFGTYPEHASEIYCEGVFQKRCDIPLQYESDGLLYWGGKSATLPVVNFPEQPMGFPVGPSA